MSSQSQPIVDTLHKLIELNKDSDRGYKEASENIDDSELKTILYRLSQQRAEFRGDLEDILHKDYKDNADPSGSFLSKLHRSWMDFKTSLSSNDNEAILEECVRGEKHAIETYEDAQKANLPAYINEKVDEQLGLIKGALNQIQEFKKTVNH